MLVLSAPALRVAAVAEVLVTVPDPASEPIAKLMPLRSSVLLLVTAGLLPKADVLPALRVPSLMVVAPA